MFEFGWMFWVLFFVVFFGCGRMCGWGARRFVDRRRGLEDGGLDEEAYRVSGPRSRAELDSGAGSRLARDAMRSTSAGDAMSEPSPLKRPRESPLEKLQRAFVDGRLTVEEYERELDRLERIE